MAYREARGPRGVTEDLPRLSRKIGHISDTAKRQKEIAAMLDTLSDQPRRVEIKPSLENKATELRQITMRRSVTVRNLRFYSPWPLNRTPWTTGRTIRSALRQSPGNRLEAPVTADTALRLGRAFGTGPEFWMNLQALYDLGSTMPDDLDQVRPLVAAK